jgi:hypothetical protein
MVLVSGLCFACVWAWQEHFGYVQTIEKEQVNQCHSLHSWFLFVRVARSSLSLSLSLSSGLASLQGIGSFVLFT